jgi:hypothetical protein
LSSSRRSAIRALRGFEGEKLLVRESSEDPPLGDEHPRFRSLPSRRPPKTQGPGDPKSTLSGALLSLNGHEFELLSVKDSVLLIGSIVVLVVIIPFVWGAVYAMGGE